MKGVILAGGTGSRLLPLTKATNKHLLPMGDKPMILHAIQKFVEANITDIMLITGTEHMGDMMNLLGSGAEWGCCLTYRVQDKPDGIAGALSLAENFVGKNRCLVILGDNIFEDNVGSLVDPWPDDCDCMLFLKLQPDPRRFGVPMFNDEGQICDIIEKPLNPPSSYCVTGIYAYSPAVFGAIQNVKKSDRGELEITDVNKEFVKVKSVQHKILPGYWADAGTLGSYHKANQVIINHSRKSLQVESTGYHGKY